MTKVHVVAITLLSISVLIWRGAFLSDSNKAVDDTQPYSSVITDSSSPIPSQEQKYENTAVSTQQYVQQTVDSDPIVSCTYTHIGTRDMKQSECKASTECLIGTQWYFSPNMDQCTKDQQEYIRKWREVNNSAPVPVYEYTSPPTIAPYSPPPKFNSDPINVHFNDPKPQVTVPVGYGY